MNSGDQIAMLHHDEVSIKNEFHLVSMQKGQLLAKKIEMAVKQKGHNRQQFASLMSVQPSVVTKWLSGNHNFTVETLFEIEYKLGIQLIAIENPIYKQMNFHMVVGSEPTQHLNSSLVQGLTELPVVQRKYSVESSSKFTKGSSHSSSLMEFIKFLNK